MGTCSPATRDPAIVVPSPLLNLQSRILLQLRKREVFVSEPSNPRDPHVRSSACDVITVIVFSLFPLQCVDSDGKDLCRQLADDDGGLERCDDQISIPVQAVAACLDHFMDFRPSVVFLGFHSYGFIGLTQSERCTAVLVLVRWKGAGRGCNRDKIPNHNDSW